MTAQTKATAGGTLAVLLGADRGKLRLMPTKKVEVKRLSELVGAPVVFTLRALTSEELRETQEIATVTKGGEETLDGALLNKHVVLMATKDPDMRDKDLLKLYDAVTPEDLLDAMLLPGELTQLASAVQELSGFGEDALTEIKN